MAEDHLKARPTKPLLTRAQQLQALQEEEYDVLVIGAGATGAGCALDAVSRGINCIQITFFYFLLFIITIFYRVENCLGRIG